MVGLFAGRGDVILSMGMAFTAGGIFAWWARGRWEAIKRARGWG